jgi:hypothetical protein
VGKDTDSLFPIADASSRKVPRDHSQKIAWWLISLSQVRLDVVMETDSHPLSPSAILDGTNLTQEAKIMSTPEDETRGIALAGELIVFALIGHLKSKGILSKEETIAIYEQTLTTLESYSNLDPSVQEARKILDQMAQIATKAPKDNPKR